MLSSLIIATIFLFATPNAEPVNRLNCIFLIPRTTSKYTCLLNGAVITEPNAPTIIEGIHSRNRTNADVQAIEVEYFRFSHIPMELFETLPNARDVSFHVGILGRLDKFQHCNGIHSLRLHGMINQTFPDLFENCQNLLSLELSQNRLSEITIAAPPSLTSLNLRGNQMRKFDVTALRNLTLLSMRINDIEILHADDFVGLENLRRLELDTNRISNIHEGTFAPMINLRQLWMQDNSITRLESHLFQGISKLEFVAFSSNRIEVIEDGVFNHLSDLDFLSLSGNVCIDEAFFLGNGRNVTSILPALKPCLP